MTLVIEGVLPWFKGEGKELENTFVLLYVNLINGLFFKEKSSHCRDSNLEPPWSPVPKPMRYHFSYPGLDKFRLLL